MTYLLFALGLAALTLGGEFLVRGASSIARHFKISPLVIGLTIVGFGTSAPELLVSVQAALDGQPAIAIGNVLGSNIANILLILGTSAAITSLLIPFAQIRRDLGFLLLATAAIWVMLLNGVVSQLEGLFLVTGLIAFLAAAFYFGKEEEEQEPHDSPMLLSIGLTVLGLIALVIGARLLVDSATEIARSFGVSEAVIGLTIVAIGTSLPELATSVVAALRRQSEIAVGNVIGSNIFNIFSILGITALITPIPVDPRFASVDMIWVAATAVGLALVSMVWHRLPRMGGIGLLLAYAAYVGLMLA